MLKSPRIKIMMVSEYRVIMERTHSKRRKLEYKRRRNKRIAAKQTKAQLSTRHKFSRELRKKLRAPNVQQPPPDPPEDTLLFGSFNVDGLDLDNFDAIKTVLELNKFDVGTLKLHWIIYKIYRSLH